jgi:hypothetical protein
VWTGAWTATLGNPGAMCIHGTDATFNPLVQGSTPWRPTGPGLRLRAPAVIMPTAREARVGPR